MDRYAFGADIGGTTVKLGLFTGEGALLEKWEIPTRTENNGALILPDVAASDREVMTRRGISANEIAGIGVGVPGPVDADGTVHKCVNLGWGVFNIRAALGALLPGISRVEAGNDANVAALGELWKGAGQGMRSAVMLTLGTGIGGGVVLDGKIVSGANGGAGEVGHITINPEEDVQCTCGKYGCLEQYASARGAANMARAMLAESSESTPLREMENFTAKELCACAAAGDLFSLRVLDRMGEMLGRAMSFISCTMDPDVFILGGGMSRAGSIVIEPAARYYRKYAFHVSADTPVTIARLGNDAGIYGCAAMVLAD